MRHTHPPIVLLIVGIILAVLAIAAGPLGVVFVVMAAPLILAMLYSARAVARGTHHEPPRPSQRREP